MDIREKKATMPKIEWIFEILKACSQVEIPVFMKDNLKPLLLDWQRLRQKFPNG